jgi:hypothetical protein
LLSIDTYDDVARAGDIQEGGVALCARRISRDFG